jgi:3-hydroxybutyryl-CoA dehydratase
MKVSGLPLLLRETALTVDESAIRRYAEMTDDFNPIHIDPEFATKSEMGGIIAHGTLSFNLICQSLTATLGVLALEKIEVDVRFRRPVRVGQRVCAGGIRKDDGYEVWVKDEEGHAVIEGVARFRDAAADREIDRSPT